MHTEATGHDESLAAVQNGESIEVVYILFDSLRAFGETRGIRSGSRLRCRASGASTLVLESESGETVLFPRDLARFIRVRRRGDGSSGVIGAVRARVEAGAAGDRPAFAQPARRG
jgi:hypothetical protein